MSSWGHTIGPIPGDRRSDPCVRCKGPYIDRPRAALEGTYRYVTGRAGRCTTRFLPLCREHGAAFAEKHGLELPATEPELPKHPVPDDIPAAAVRQYEHFSSSVPGAVLLLEHRGDLLAFAGHAEILAQACPMAGMRGNGGRVYVAAIPNSLRDTAIAALIAAGHRVAVEEVKLTLFAETQSAPK